MKHRLDIVILGCGGRGRTFAKWIEEHPEDARLVAVADPIPAARDFLAERHAIAPAMRFDSWETAMRQPRMADIVINTLMDRLHVAAALAALERGYHMLLEKPMAVTLDDCIAIDAARRRHGAIVSVCHSLRYHPVYARVKQLIADGAVGQIVSVDQLEGVDPQHQSHSFIRGNWARSADSTFMLLAKSCHDIDILCYLVGKPVTQVSSFGRLSHFNAEHAPAGAPARCSDGCPHDSACPYSAYRLYVQNSGYAGWIPNLTSLPEAQRVEFIRTSPYGRCVYHCDNDAVDHQVVSMEFTDGATATFTMTAFAPGGRRLRVHGTHGYIEADIAANRITLTKFWNTWSTSEIAIPAADGTHGGGDDNVIAALLQAVRTGDAKHVLTLTDESLATHAAVFAAERSRRLGMTMRVDELLAST